jgi:hypothetical protein
MAQLRSTRARLLGTPLAVALLVVGAVACGARTGVRQIADAGSSDAARDATTGDGSAADGGSKGIQCGASVCTPPAEFCCVVGSSPNQRCLPADVPGPRCDFGAHCDGAEDCAPGDQCCSPSGAIAQTYCFHGTCPAGRALCHQPSECTADELCCPSREFGWDHQVCTPGPKCPF